MPFVRTGDLVTYYELSGPSGAPVVAFANSLGTNVHIWDAQRDAFARTFRVLRYDMRGHGLTSAGTPGRVISIATLADDLAALLDALAIPSVRLVGLSIGGMVAQRFAAAYPHRVDALVLCATGSRIGTSEVWQTRIATVEREGIGAIVEATMERWFTPRAHREQPVLVAGFATMLARAPLSGYVAGCRAIEVADLRADDAGITAPTLVVAGAGDVVTPPASGEELCALIGGAELVVLDDAAHILCAEQPAAFDAAVLGFLSGARAARNGAAR
ncbi:MAG TPA: 3-oxoadipate enol-lactonase [Candidatus Limnocylindria bacterium]|nr:3-oxoadipate enol-lactonase [Candidatus Limnocylindria bacterium]